MKRSSIAICLLLISASLAGCGERPAAPAVSRQEAAGVTVAEVKPVEVGEYIEAPGTIKARATSLVAAMVMGAVKSVNVREGESVKAGQTLITIDDSGAIERVRAAEAGYNEAIKGLEASREKRSLSETTYQRYSRLLDEKAISQQEFDQIETDKRTADIEYGRMELAVKRAGAALNEARVYLGYSRITAPASGIITEKRVDAGSMATPGVPLLVVEDTSSFTIDFSLDERLSSIRPGAPVEVEIGSLGKIFDGRVTNVVPSVDPSSRTFLAKASVKGDGLRSGLYAKVRVPYGKRSVIAVDRAALVSKGQLTGVYAVDEKGVITYRLIRTGPAYGETVEVLSGLVPGDRIITRGADKAVDGGVVK